MEAARSGRDDGSLRQAFATAGAQGDAVAIVNAAHHVSAMMLRRELTDESVLALESSDI
jgi:hypothetical protein